MFKKVQIIIATPCLLYYLNKASIFLSERKKRGRHAYDDPDRIVWVKPTPWTLCCTYALDALR